MFFPQKSPPLPVPPPPEPTAQDASPWLLPEIDPRGALQTHGDDVRTVLSIAANLNPRPTPAAAERSAPESPRTACGAPPPPPAGRSRTWHTPPPSPRS